MACMKDSSLCYKNCQQLLRAFSGLCVWLGEKYMGKKNLSNDITKFIRPSYQHTKKTFPINRQKKLSYMDVIFLCIMQEGSNRKRRGEHEQNDDGDDDNDVSTEYYQKKEETDREKGKMGKRRCTNGTGSPEDRRSQYNSLLP